MAAALPLALVDIRVIDGVRCSWPVQAGLWRVAVSPVFSASSAEAQCLIFRPRSEAPPINPSPIRSNSPVDGSVAEEPAVTASIKCALVPAGLRAMLVKKDKPPRATAKLKSVPFAQAAAGRRNRMSVLSKAIHLSLIFLLITKNP